MSARARAMARRALEVHERALIPDAPPRAGILKTLLVTSAAAAGIGAVIYLLSPEEDEADTAWRDHLRKVDTRDAPTSAPATTATTATAVTAPIPPGTALPSTTP